MFKNYLIIAIRNFWKNKIFSFINIIGLSIGISAALVIFLIVQYDFSFDKFEKDADRIYRVTTNMNFAGEPFPNSGVTAPLPDAARKEITGLDEMAAFHELNGETKVTVPDDRAGKPQVFKKQPDIIFADQHYFNLLSYQWVAGSPQTSFEQPFRVVLTEKRARIYFPHQDMGSIIGKRVIYNDSIRTTVSGIVRELKENSDFIFKEFISLSTIPSSGLKNNYGWTSWGSVNSSSQCFVKLSKGTAPAVVEKNLLALSKKNNPNENTDKNSSTAFYLQPLKDMHFEGKYGVYSDHIGHKPTLYGLLTLAVFLLLLGCINFINLTTAQASQRAKEIGIRKTMGSSRKQLIFQFLSETFFITLAATVLSIVLTPVLLKVFSDFIPKELHFRIFQQPGMMIFLVLLILVVSLLSGFYPALILSRYNPISVLKSQAHTGSAGAHRAWLRKGLTLSQFFIAQVFIMATLITGKQIYYMLNADLGFKKEAIVSFGVPFNFSNFDHPDGKRFVLLNELRSIPGIQLISMGGGSPATGGWATSTMTYKDGKKEIETDVEQKSGDTNYLRLFHLRILAGRNVQQSDTVKEYLLNENYMHVLGFRSPQDALNKIIEGHPIVGVLADFHQQSLRTAIKPLVFYSQQKFAYDFHIALMPQDGGNLQWPAVIGRVGAAYKKLYPDTDFNYEFFDDSIAKLYKSEQDIARLLKWATGLAIFISCMGLLGLVMYTTHLRKKEIGVRKVLGATVSNIIGILSKDFVALVALAFLSAIPVVWWAMHKWLENFAYRTTMNWWVFLISGLLMLSMALLTMGIQTFRAANANPVDSLRTE
jgi:putative ABC transport system permease protein